MPGYENTISVTSAPATITPSAERETGDLRQHRVAERVPADEPLGRPERLEVVRVVGLELVDDHVAHADRPAAEHHQEERQERQEPVGVRAQEELPR